MFISGWRPCLHNSAWPLPIKGVWTGALSLARGDTEHRGRSVCKAARVILSNQAKGGLNTLLWVILQKSSWLNVSLSRSICLVRTWILPRWPKVNLLMDLYNHGEQKNAGAANAAQNSPCGGTIETRGLWFDWRTTSTFPTACLLLMLLNKCLLHDWQLHICNLHLVIPVLPAS